MTPLTPLVCGYFRHRSGLISKRDLTVNWGALVVGALIMGSLVQYLAGEIPYADLNVLYPQPEYPPALLFWKDLTATGFLVAMSFFTSKLPALAPTLDTCLLFLLARLGYLAGGVSLNSAQALVSFSLHQRPEVFFANVLGNAVGTIIAATLFFPAAACKQPADTNKKND